MAVLTEVSTVSLLGDGSSNEFSPGFPVLEATHLRVRVDGALKTLGVHYDVVTPMPSPNPRVVFRAGNTPSATAVVTLERSLPITQPVDFREGGPFSPEAHTRSFDRRAMVEQQLERRVARLETLVGGSGGGGEPFIAGDGLVFDLSGPTPRLNVGAGAGTTVSEDAVAVTLDATAPQSVTAGSNLPGSVDKAARVDHAHSHGELPGGALHALATDEAAGFMSAEHFTGVEALLGTGKSRVLCTLSDSFIVPNETPTVIEWDVVEGDVGAVASGVYTAPRTGWYQVTAQVIPNDFVDDISLVIVVRDGGDDLHHFFGSPSGGTTKSFSAASVAVPLVAGQSLLVMLEVSNDDEHDGRGAAGNISEPPTTLHLSWFSVVEL